MNHRLCALCGTAAVLLAGFLVTPAVAQPGFTSLSTVRFDIRYQRGVGEGAAAKIGAYLEEDYDYLSAILGLDRESRTEVRIYDAPGKFLGATGERTDRRAALYRRGIIHVRTPSRLPADVNLEKALSAELALAILDGAAANGCPHWLTEAFAAYHSGIVPDLVAPVEMRVRSFSDLGQELQREDAFRRREDVLYVLGHTMKFFLERYGEEKALGVFRAFNGTDTPDMIFRTQFGAGVQEVEAEWAEYISSHSRPLKPLR